MSHAHVLGYAAVFPVYAGVIPGLTHGVTSNSSVPRVCGGDPKLSYLARVVT